jgi:hypothetical protein
VSAAALSRAALFVPMTSCTRTAYRVLILAAHVAETDDACESRAPLSRSWAARILGCPLATVQRGVRQLVALGLLVPVEAPHRLTGREWQPTVYVVMPAGGEYGPSRK